MIKKLIMCVIMSGMYAAEISMSGDSGTFSGSSSTSPDGSICQQFEQCLDGSFVSFTREQVEGSFGKQNIEKFLGMLKLEEGFISYWTAKQVQIRDIARLHFFLINKREKQKGKDKKLEEDVFLIQGFIRALGPKEVGDLIILFNELHK